MTELSEDPRAQRAWCIPTRISCKEKDLIGSYQYGKKIDISALCRGRTLRRRTELATDVEFLYVRKCLAKKSSFKGNPSFLQKTQICVARNFQVYIGLAIVHAFRLKLKFSFFFCLRCACNSLRTARSCRDPFCACHIDYVGCRCALRHQLHFTA